MRDERDFTQWIAEQTRRSASAMQQAISATHLVRDREAVAQRIIPAVGSVLASPCIADWNPAPDYFFHWVRDAAAVMSALVDLMQMAGTREDERWRRHFEDVVRFSLALIALDGAPSLRQGGYYEAARPEARQFLRPPDEIAALRGDSLLGEPRFNADGTPDIFRWARPQYDGPALRALACLRYLAAGGRTTEDIERLLAIDLDFTLRHAGEACVGPWEEEQAQHYHVALVQLGALVHGQDYFPDRQAREAAERALRTALERHWSERHGIYAAVWPLGRGVADDLVDASQLLAVLDSDLPQGPHSMTDVRVRQTLTAIERLFAREFPINARFAAPALGRYRADRYFGGGAWYPTTLAAAALYYRLAQRSPAEREVFIDRGDAYLMTVRALTPADGALSEQVDRVTGKQTSAQHLTWSYAAFIGAAAARERCL
ncbi:MAG TPA: glycoside hydrolase family 15 protein [Pseudolabrys sp.]|nr:glycoside hydrolase family 15 protein [Pseudolabrys sp.]